MTVLTAAAMVMVGMALEALLVVWTTGAGFDWLSWVVLASYIIGGAVVFAVGDRDDYDPTAERWSIEVLSWIIRGPSATRHRALRVLVWLAVGHFAAAGVVVAAIVDALGTFGF